MQDTPFINVEYIFVKIYDFIIYVKNVVLTGSFSAASGGGSDFALTFERIGSWLVTLFSIAIIIFIIWLIYIRVRIFEIDEYLDGEYKAHFVQPVVKEQFINNRWEANRLLFASANHNDWKAAIIDADIMLDELVTSLGYTGESLGAKLMTIQLRDFPTLQLAWEAHKIRNKLAHQAQYSLSEREKEVARKNYESIFKSAGII